MIDLRTIDDKGAQEKYLKYLNNRFTADLLEVAQTETGRRFLWRLMELSPPLARSFTKDSQTYFNLGLQEVGKQLLSILLDTEPAERIYLEMKREARRQAEKDRAWLDSEIQRDKQVIRRR